MFSPIRIDVAYLVMIIEEQDIDENLGTGYDCTQFMMRKPAFGEGIGGLMGISEPPE